jgi:hypothetical protein
MGRYLFVYYVNFPSPPIGQEEKYTRKSERISSGLEIQKMLQNLENVWIEKTDINHFGTTIFRVRTEWVVDQQIWCNKTAKFHYLLLPSLLQILTPSPRCQER